MMMVFSKAFRGGQVFARIAPFVLFVSACVSSAPPAVTFDLAGGASVLSEPSVSAAGRAGAGPQIVVVEPSALQTLDGERVVVRMADGSLAFLSGARWADRLPRLVQVRLVRKLEDAGFVARVGRATDRIQAARSLQLDVRRFELNVAEPRQAVVEITAKLVDESTGRIVRARTFEASRPDAPMGAQSALNLEAAFEQIMAQLIDWVR